MVGVNKRPNRICLALTSCDLDVLEAFKVVVGGRIYEIQKTAIGSRRWQWQEFKREEALRIIRLLHPYMLTRRAARMQEALDYVPVDRRKKKNG
jgi:hypothetical protein